MPASTNVMVALYNILDRNSTILSRIIRSDGSANAAGDSLEFFVKDMFCTGASQYQGVDQKQPVYERFLSWTGNSSNFPDFIVRGGVGVEPKKMNNRSRASLSLNSSYPKDYIYPDTQNIPRAENMSTEEEGWERKSIIYAVGNMRQNDAKLFSLWLVYGNTFIADRQIYLDRIDEIRTLLRASTASLSETRELGRLLRIDPSGSTNLRIRPMYELKHPTVVFNQFIPEHVFPEDSSEIFVVITLEDLNELESQSITPDLTCFINEGRLIRTDIDLPDPNDATRTIPSVIFCGYTD